MEPGVENRSDLWYNTAKQCHRHEGGIAMARIRCCVANEKDIPFLDAVYTENMAALHGAPRSRDAWSALLSDRNTIYYIVYTDSPVGWFRLDAEDNGLWLGMLQIKPSHQRRGIGRAVLAAAEKLAAERGYRTMGIHTTQDNLAARGLYTACGYTLTEVGPCTTADGVERTGCTFCKNL